MQTFYSPIFCPSEKNVARHADGRAIDKGLLGVRDGCIFKNDACLLFFLSLAPTAPLCDKNSFNALLNTNLTSSHSLLFRRFSRFPSVFAFDFQTARPGIV